MANKRRYSSGRCGGGHNIVTCTVWYICIYKTPLAHVVVSPIATCTGDVFPYTHSFLRAKKLFAGASCELHPF